jgi:hypothetical protein
MSCTNALRPQRTGVMESELAALEQRLELLIAHAKVAARDQRQPAARPGRRGAQPGAVGAVAEASAGSTLLSRACPSPRNEREGTGSGERW